MHTESDKETGDKELYVLCTIAMGLAVLITIFSNFKGDGSNGDSSTDNDEEERDIFVPSLKVEINLGSDSKAEASKEEQS